ncbi:hypothetical protein J3E72DRAFT_380164 [Bipolaris maydis]|nr:hypothetical protein J3E72DRAFT_380164 [Bipolaris maydis]
MEGKEFGGCYFSKLQFGDIRIRILMESVARLEAVRLSGAEKLKKVFRRLKTEKRWWIVDFFENDSSGNERAALNWKQEAVRSFFYPPTREWSAIRPPGKALLQKTIHDDARCISTTQGIGDAFRELSQLPSLWSIGTFTYLSDVRKSFCYEEAENYIWAIVDQWRDITLQWDSRILQCVDFEFVNVLQSRAPAFSNEDHEFIQKEFRKGHILPLKDSQLRLRVESVICCQGPILTLNTFAQDVRLLQVSVRQPLNGLLPKMEKAKGDTLRTRICEIIETKFDEISGENNLPKATNNQRQKFIRRCYYHVFLHTIRTKKYRYEDVITNNSITEVHIKNLVEEELKLRCIVDRGSLQNLTTNESVILTQTSADSMPETEANVERRHGHLLFRNPVARKYLYYDRINDSRVSTLVLTPSSMAMHIMRVFLLGRRAIQRVMAPSPGLPAANLQSFYTPELPKLFEINPISDHALDNVRYDENFPTCPATSTIPNVRSVQEARTWASISPLESMAASMVSNDLSPASSIHTPTTKRPASVSEFGPLSALVQRDERPRKRQRSWFDQEEQNIVSESHHQGHNSSVSGLMPSPSDYSVAEETPSISSNSDQNKYHCLELAEEYSNIIEKYNKLNNENWKSQFDVTSNIAVMAGSRHPTSKSIPNISANRATYQPQAVTLRRKLPDFVLFESLSNPQSAERVSRTMQDTKRFAARQNEVDRYSRFLYRLKQGYMIANNGKQLYKAIQSYGLRKVLVDSETLAKP